MQSLKERFVRYVIVEGADVGGGRVGEDNKLCQYRM